MALIDHFDKDAQANGFAPIPVHEFVSSLQLFAAPSPVVVTKAMIISFWSLTENPTADDDEAQLDEMIAVYSALATKDLQNEYINTIENVLHLYRTDKITPATAKTWIGLT